MVYDALVIGATYFCAGILSVSDKNIAVLERKTLCGYEFCDALKGNENENIYKYFENRDVFLASEISNISEKDGIFEVEFFTVSGFEKISAKRIIDTTYKDEDIIKKSLNAVVLTKDGKREVLKCEVDKNESYINARKAIKNSLKDGMKIDYIAPVFEVALNKDKLVSASYENSNDAFLSGVSFAKEEL